MFGTGVWHIKLEGVHRLRGRGRARCVVVSANRILLDGKGKSPSAGGMIEYLISLYRHFANISN